MGDEARRRTVVPILLYHDVTDSPTPALERWTVSPMQFRGHLAAIAACGRTALTISALAQRLAHGETTGELMGITFDDGCAGSFTAAEALAGLGFPSTIYVTTGYVGGDGMIDEAALHRFGGEEWLEVGAHGVRHLRLDELTRPAVRRELRVSRDILDDMLGRPISSFAYPHGAYSKAVRREVAAAGYTSAVAVKNAISHSDDDVLALARWTVTPEHTAHDIARILAGEGAPLAWRRERLRTVGYRAARRARRRASANGRRAG